MATCQARPAGTASLLNIARRLGSRLIAGCSVRIADEGKPGKPVLSLPRGGPRRPEGGGWGESARNLGWCLSYDIRHKRITFLQQDALTSVRAFCDKPAWEPAVRMPKQPCFRIHFCSGISPVDICLKNLKKHVVPAPTSKQHSKNINLQASRAGEKMHRRAKEHEGGPRRWRASEFVNQKMLAERLGSTRSGKTRRRCREGVALQFPQRRVRGVWKALQELEAQNLEAGAGVSSSWPGI